MQLFSSLIVEISIYLFQIIFMFFFKLSVLLLIQNYLSIDKFVSRSFTHLKMQSLVQEF